MITTLLVANRGEIARRIFRTCRDLGIGTVAVFSDADADSPYVAEADAAVHLPGNAAAETYLRVDVLVAAAARAGADAVHPGYGFLAENADFAAAVEDAGLLWIGPPPAAIEAMGAKITARKLMAAAGVPVLDELDPAAIAQADLPVMIKASAGGGGRGLRVVRSLTELPAQLEAARSEAASAFGDPTVFCERFLAKGRHIEVQVMADRHGTVWAVGERECSIQRRHQKVIEEAPSPLVDAMPGMRDRLFAAATEAARAIGYTNAGTVEFLAEPGGQFYFLEMNTRLQVEHPVTECTTGLDLVQLQLQVADGTPLPESPPGPADGHAIEARLYAEDPAQEWQPQTGTIHRLDVPGVAARFAVPPHHGVRLDAGVAPGSSVSVFYDPLLAKLISWAPTRRAAAGTLAGALGAAHIHGLPTNRDLLIRVLRHPGFLSGAADTTFLEHRELRAPLADDATVRLSALAAALADAARRRVDAAVLAGLPSGWRNVPSQLQVKRYEGIDIAYRLDRKGLLAPDFPDVRLVRATPDQVVLDVAEVRRRFEVATYHGLICVDSALGAVALKPRERFSEPTAAALTGSLVAPMPGMVIRLAVARGQTVHRGQPLLWLEAMKMEHPIAAPADGVIAQLPVRVGQQVDVGSVLVVLEPELRAEGERQ